VVTRPAARLVMAFEACELSDLARELVPVDEDEPRTDALADAARVLAAAHRFVIATVVHERVAGAGWSAIGDALGLPAAAAQERYAAAEARFRARLRSAADEPEPAGPPGELSWWRAHIVREPREAALDLDDWVLRHEDGGHHGATPVSGGLDRLDPDR
jgi:hypothetical protein